jgi:hypothetical protein
MSQCDNCKRIIPQEMLSTMFTNEGVTGEICGVCALDISNKALGIERTEFRGEIAEGMRQEALAYYKDTNQL